MSTETIGRFEVHTLPDGSVIYYDDDEHAYYSEIKPAKGSVGGYAFTRGSRLTGVSTIAKFLDANVDPLLWWAVGLDQVGIAELAERDMSTGADVTWLSDPERIKSRLKDEKTRWSDVRDRAADVGTTVHEDVFHALARDETPDLADRTDVERGFAQGVLRWWMDNSPQVIAAEAVTVDFSKGYAGRFDLLCEIDGERVLVDAKTRATGRIRKSDHVQLEGYNEANLACGIGGSDRRVALLLSPDGSYREHESVAKPSDFYAALLACEAGKLLDKRLREADKTREAVPA